MGSTYLSLHYHITFSTKERQGFIKDGWSEELYKYIGGTVNGLGGQAQGIGGIEDHMHLLLGLRATHCVADVVREIKKAATIWVHDKIKLSEFSWQEGYAAFTVSPPARPGVRAYIGNQREHHRGRGYREELIDLLTLAEIEFDPQYLD